MKNIIKNIKRKFNMEKEEIIKEQEEKNTKNPSAENKNMDVNNEELEDETPKTETELLTEENEKLKQEAGEVKDKYLRLFAEFDNFKKRNARERIDLMKLAGQDIIRDLLPVMDDFERAFKVEEDADKKLPDGIQLVYNKLSKVLENKNVVKMAAKGESFDSELHDALTEIPAPSDDLKGKIVDVIEEGYTMNDKIIRHAKVVVGK